MTRLLSACLASLILFLTACDGGHTVIENIDDAAHARVGVMTGTTGEAIAYERLPESDIKSFDDIMDAVAALKSGQLDALITGYPAAVHVVGKNPGLKLLDEAMSHEDTSIALRKDEVVLQARLNRLIDELKLDGTLDDMKRRWFKNAPGPYEEPEIVLPATGELLRIGVSATREPFNFVDQDGRITGHDGELARIISARLQRPIEFSNMKFMALIPALQSGKVDLIVTGMTATEERKRQVSFTQPYFANAQVMLVRNSAAPATGGSNPEDSTMTGTDDLNDKRIGVLMGSVFDRYISSTYPKATQLQYQTMADVVLALKTDKIDAALFDEEPLRVILRTETMLAEFGERVLPSPLGVGFKKGSPLRDEFNAFLASLKQSGQYDEMVGRWITRGETTMQDITTDGANGMLTVATSNDGLPFGAVQDNRSVGFDIELVSRFAAAQGKTLKIDIMDFGSLIAAASSGKADMIISSIFITAERQKQIDFSDPYFQTGSRFAVRKASLIPPETAVGQTHQGTLDSPEDLANGSIGVLLGSVHDTYALRHFPQAAVKQYKSPSDLILAVKSQRIDAAIYTRETLVDILRDDPTLGLLGDSLQEYPIGMGFNQENDALRVQFNTFLREIKQNGTYEDMVSRWLKRGETVMPKIENAGNNGVLVVGNVSDKGLPFTIVQNNRLIGFDIELTDRFGAWLGKKVQYADMEFGNLITAVAANKIDMIASTLMLTDERKKKVDFSDPYYALGANFFALQSRISDSAKALEVSTEPGFFVSLAQSFESNILHEKRYLLIWDGLKTTVVISVLATLFGTLLGALVCFLRMSPRLLLNLPARIYINVLRGMPVLVLLMLIFYVVFASVNISPVLVAVIAFGMNFGAYVAEIYRSGIQSIERGQSEAGISMGFTKLQTFLHIIMPQTIQRILPVYKGEFISLVKMTSIVGYIAVQDLTKASDIIRSRTFDAFFPLVMVAILYFLISWVLMLALEYLERRTDPRQRRRKAVRK
jgi:polar amino acid transport system substrate-binding protein